VTLVSDSPRRRNKRRPFFSFAHARLREIERVIPLLDVPQTRALLPEVAYTIWVKLTHRGRPILDDELPDRIQAWFEARCAEIFTRDEIEAAADDAKRRDNRLANADNLAELLDLQYADRQRLAIYTIGAVDKTKRQREILKKERKREHDRAMKEAERRAQGSTSREQYLAASLSRTRPWLAEGISRRTWYRRLGTSASPTPTYSQREQPVPEISDVRSLPSRKTRRKAERRAKWKAEKAKRRFEQRKQRKIERQVRAGKALVWGESWEKFEQRQSVLIKTGG
jgi:hypothetical protein